MTIEKEARDIASGIIKGDDAIGGYEQRTYHRVLKALQKKQDRIEELERSCGLLGLEKNACERKIKDLESALKEIAKDEYYSEDCLHAKLAKKAIGGGNE